MLSCSVKRTEVVFARSLSTVNVIDLVLFLRRYSCIALYTNDGTWSSTKAERRIRPFLAARFHRKMNIQMYEASYLCRWSSALRAIFSTRDMAHKKIYKLP